MIPVYLYITSVLVAAIVSHIRLEGRVNTQEQKQIDLKELINAKLDNLTELVNVKLNPIEQRLGRIEKSMNGHLKD